MKIKVTDKIDQESHDRIIKLLVEYNLSKTQEFKKEINNRRQLKITKYLEIKQHTPK